MSEAQTEPCPACGSVLDVTGAQIFAERTCPVCGTQINVRRTFGHYELMSLVGHGGQGLVYRAVDNTLNRLVALKLLRTEYSNDPEFVKQFESEARVTASINHPNVVRVFSFGSGEGHVYLAMELVDNGTFDDLMEKLGRVPEARALQIGIETARGLKAGFEMGLIHRDVKPGNILFASDGTAKVVDFGLAMFFEQEASQTGEIWGTPYYLSPERLNRVQEDFRSDMYSLGAALFHAIAGRPPFEAQDASHVALKHLRTQAASIQAYAPNVSNATAYVINRTLAKNPAERQQSYDEFIEQLQFAREEALARAAGGGTQKKARVVLEDEGSQRAMSIVTIGTLVLLLGGLIFGGRLVYKAMRGDTAAPPNVTEAGVATLERFGPGWGDAKTSLVTRNYPTAATQFNQLATTHPQGSTERSWAIVHQALAIALNGDSSRAAQKLGELAGGGTQVSKFYLEQVMPKLASGGPVPSSAAKDFSRTNLEVFGALFFAVKDFEMGSAEDARALFSQFASTEPEPAMAWASDFLDLGKPYKNELDIAASALDSWTKAKNPKARADAIVALQKALSKLPASSKLKPRVEKILAEAGKTVAEDRTVQMKSNLAFGAKVTSSTLFAANPPEMAVDGDFKTRWRTGDKDDNRWLALDLGSPKTISRWVLRLALSAGERVDGNLSDFKLQRSDDGAKWEDVDSVLENRMGITDRLVKPFTARHVRILCLRNMKAEDKIARIYEVGLTLADEQAKAEYTHSEGVATRFSPASDFVSSPIGWTGARGSASFDEKTQRYVVQGSGADVWGNVDAFQFVYQPLRGNGEIVACVRSLDAKNEWSKAIVMIRNGVGKDAAHGMMSVAAGGKAQFVHRKKNGQPTISINKTDLPTPRWIKVTRAGSVITGYQSADGKTWQEVGKETMEGFTDLTFVGFGVCARAEGQMCTAEFSDVSITKANP